MRKGNLLLTLVAWMASMAMMAQATLGNLSPLHVEGNQLKDQHGNTVVLHGVMDTPSPYFNNYRWGNQCNSSGISPCLSYFNKLFTAITDSTSGAYCNLFRLHLDPCWTNDPSKQSDGKESGEADISRYNGNRLTVFMRTLYSKIATNGMKHGLYIIMRPPGVCPGTIQVGGDYQNYLLDVWDRVTKNDTILKYSGQISIELANEPVRVLDANGQDSEHALYDFFQPIVDKIRSNGYTGIIWVPGTGWQSNYRNYAKYPIQGENIGYAVHDYVGWYGTSDDSYDHQNAIKQFGESVPVVKTNPIVITEVDWSPYKEGTGHYNEHGDWVLSNYGTWATGTTSKWGNAYKAVLDYYGNISMTLSGTACYIDIDEYINNKKVVPAFKTAMEAKGLDPHEASGVACFEWYKEYAQKDYPTPAYKRAWTADQGNGTFINPIMNADFPDPDVIRVDDTYYMVSTTMYHFPGATLMKSKDLVNWEYCANPLQQIDSNDAYNLENGASHYAQGQWAASLSYHAGKFYLYFICYGRSGVDDTQNILLTTTDPAGTWKMEKMTDHYYDSGWLFDDGENGDGYVYVACGIGDIWVNKLNANTLKKISSERVLSLGNGLEGSHMYHIGDYYYIYATYGGTEGSQTIFRSKNPMGPYEEHEGRVFANQRIHQGGLVETQTGEWWTILFKDAGAIGRIPYLEPVKWVDGWPVLGNNGIDVSKDGNAYAKPNVGAFHERTYLPTNDTFTGTGLGLQWEWNHNPDNSAWSLMERPGYLRLHTANVTDELNWAHNSLSQRILGYSPNGTASDKYFDSYGTVKMDIANMQEGDVAGLAVFQNPYSFIGVKVVDGKKRLFSESCTFNSQKLEKTDSKLGDEVDADVIYLRAVVNFGTNACTYYYSTDNATWTKWGCTMSMRFTLDYFVGQRFYLFNYATKQLGGYVDIDWFSTEPDSYSEEKFFAPGTLKTYTEEDLTMESLTCATTNLTLLTGSAYALNITSTSKSGLIQNVAASCEYDISNPEVAMVTGGRIITRQDGECTITATYTDVLGNSKSVTILVTSATFPLSKDGLNPSIYSTGTYNEKTKYLVTGQYGFGGWKYESGVDLSAYNYLVVKLMRTASCSPSFRIFDQNNYWSSPYEFDMSKTKTAVIDLQNMKNGNGDPVDPSHIYIAGFWSRGGTGIYISEIFLSMDGVTPATDIEAVFADEGQTAEAKEFYSLSGMRLDQPQKGVNIVKYSDGSVRKVWVK